MAVDSSIVALNANFIRKYHHGVTCRCILPDNHVRQKAGDWLKRIVTTRLCENTGSLMSQRIRVSSKSCELTFLYHLIKNIDIVLVTKSVSCNCKQLKASCYYELASNKNIESSVDIKTFIRTYIFVRLMYILKSPSVLTYYPSMTYGFLLSCFLAKTRWVPQ